MQLITLEIALTELIYLAAPYSGTAEEIEQRMEAFCAVDALLMRDGYFTVSPLLKHFTLKYADLPGTWEYWEDYSYQLMMQCKAMIIIKLPGWQESAGVAGEIAIANRLKVQIIYYDPATRLFH